ncbi:MAG TPA: 3'(2'),5'-bisphosphate nucleotidase CysQ [Thermomicrobiales bacterium]|nr:3'(2'),5'-bisphosphate nucleotidase CysQ [Thermomicrobiales bacterium]
MPACFEHDAAARIATEAGQVLLALRERAARQEIAPQVLRDKADHRSHDMLMRALTASFPNDPILSEEANDDGARLDSRRVWIIDPLDGTREYGEPGRTDWAVHVALVIDEQPLAGAVALPARGMTLSTAEPPMLPDRRTGPARIVVSRTRPPAVALDLEERLGADLLEMGSAGAKAMAVVLGEADIYVHSGGQHEWDSAAPVAVAAAAGLHVSRIDGTPLRYNQPDSWLPDLLICRSELRDQVLDALGSALT